VSYIHACDVQVCGADISLESDDGLTAAQLAASDASVRPAIREYLASISRDAPPLT
jgi:hypothetical protein